MKIKIEGMEFEAFEGETILEVARRNNIQIPTICFLSGCSPTVACKMCMVEVSGKRVYSCNAKVKDGMEVLIATEEILNDRKEIMTTYCVNHPLECGVCDKSGECELQDFTLHTKVDLQLFGLQEADKKSFSFAQSFYDPALCIMCERCVTTCKDNIGEANLKAGKAKLFTPDNYKDSMGKDPYSVWSKRQKGLIEFVGKNECKDCGECISVCPVGAMTYKDFTYTSNAWELEKIHSTCGYCAGGCELIYNVKHLDVKGDLQKVYRVQNDYLYNPICGAGRFAFDMVSIGTRNIESALNAFKKADSINVGSDVSNEEALLANLISKKFNIPLFNHEAKCFSSFRESFLNASIYYKSRFYDEVAQQDRKLSFSHFFATFADFKASNSFVALNTYFKYDSPSVRYKINNNLKIQKSSQVLSIGLFHDSLLESLSKNVMQINCKSSSVALSGILALVFANDLIDDFEECFPNSLKMFLKGTSNKEQLDNAQDTQEKVDVQENQEEKVDNLSPYNIDIITRNLNIDNLDSLKVNKNGVLIISQFVFDEFLSHDFTNYDGYGLQSYHTESNPPNITEAVATTIMENITETMQQEFMDNENKLQILAHLLSFICQKLQLKLLFVPKGANVMGVSSICNLTWDNKEKVQNYTIGIRSNGDFVLDSNLDTIKPNFPLPTLAQSEGSITNMEMRLLPLNPNIPYLDSSLESALDLNDIAKELSVFDDNMQYVEYIGDLTGILCEYSPFYKKIEHRDLIASYTKDGRDVRGYFLKFLQSTKDDILNFKFSLRFKDDINFNAILLETQNHFNHTTLSSNNMQSKSGIYTSSEFLDKNSLKDGDLVCLSNDSSSIYSHIYCDVDLKDSILLVSPLIDGVYNLFENGFTSYLQISKCNMNDEVERNMA